MKKTKPPVKANSVVKSGSSQGVWDSFFAEASVDLPDRDQPPMQNRDFSGRPEVTKKKKAMVSGKMATTGKTAKPIA